VKERIFDFFEVAQSEQRVLRDQEGDEGWMRMEMRPLTAFFPWQAQKGAEKGRH